MDENLYAKALFYRTDVPNSDELQLKEIHFYCWASHFIFYYLHIRFVNVISHSVRHFEAEIWRCWKIGGIDKRRQDMIRLTLLELNIVTVIPATSERRINYFQMYSSGCNLHVKIFPSRIIWRKSIFSFIFKHIFSIALIPINNTGYQLFSCYRNIFVLDQFLWNYLMCAFSVGNTMYVT